MQEVALEEVAARILPPGPPIVVIEVLVPLTCFTTYGEKP
jgi:hypothetical protein